MGSSTLYLLFFLVGLSSSMPALKLTFIVNKNTTDMVLLGARATIDCNTNVPNAKITLWKVHGANRVEVVASHNVIVSQGYYFIEPTFSNDFGLYECKAVDTLGKTITRKQRIRLDKSKAALVMNSGRTRMEVLAGSSFTLTCESTNMADDIHWRFTHMQQKPVYSVNKYRVKSDKYQVSKDIQKSVLVVRKASVRFSGHYQCYIKKAGKQEMYVRVIAPQLPSFRNPFHQTMSVKEGKSTKLHCDVNGSPKPTVTWKKDGKPLKTCTKIFLHRCDYQPYLKTKKELKIVSTSFAKDNGTFTCEATNIAGTTVKTFDVNVLVAPDLSSSPSSLTIQDMRSPKQHDITCTDSKGNPPAKFTWQFKLTWYQDPNVKYPWMTPKKFHKVSSKDSRSSTITVPTFITNAKYKCTAENSSGKVSHTIKFLRI